MEAWKGREYCEVNRMVIVALKFFFSLGREERGGWRGREREGTDEERESRRRDLLSTLLFRRGLASSR